MVKMWKLSHTDVCDCGERQTMSHLMTRGVAPNCTWTDLAIPTLAGVNCAKHWEEYIYERLPVPVFFAEMHGKQTGTC